MTPRELAAAIRKGHTMIGESKEIHWDRDSGCGCALGAGMVGSGVQYTDYLTAVTTPTNKDITFDERIGVLLGIREGLAHEISFRHVTGESRVAIADWLDTLDVSKPKDAQTFDDFMKATMVAVELEKPVRSEIDSLAK